TFSWMLSQFTIFLFLHFSQATPIPKIDRKLFTSEFFAVADKNGDGKIDFGEFLHVNQQYVNKMVKEFAKMDYDGSDSLDMEEFTALSEDEKNRYFIGFEKESSKSDEEVIVIHRTNEGEMKELSNSLESWESDELDGVIDSYGDSSESD
ncbi:hypothetical protein PFISCL1PPCAC_25257, partial [Pristionchus fissidentatus]